MTLITIEEAKSLGRPLGDIKGEKLTSYIKEVENTQIKPSLGDALFKDLQDPDKKEEDPLSTLLNGGEYKDGSGVFRSFAGLKVAISYFVYVKILMSGDLESTRYGFVEKQGMYSQHLSTAARSAAYNEAMEVAQHYLNECVAFCKDKDLIDRKNIRRGVTSGGCTIKKIG